MTSPPSFTCPECGRTSYNPNDIEQRYCGNCHWWTGDPVLGHGRRGPESEAMDPALLAYLRTETTAPAAVIDGSCYWPIKDAGDG